MELEFTENAYVSLIFGVLSQSMQVKLFLQS